MSKALFAIAASMALLTSSTGLAAFVINDVDKVKVSDAGAVKVVSLGVFTTTAITQVNKFAEINDFGDRKLVTAAAGFAPNGNAVEFYTSTLAAATYEVFFVNARNTNVAGKGAFEITFLENDVVGVIASNAYSFSGLALADRIAANVWGNLGDSLILAAISAALADTNFNPIGISVDGRGTTLNDLRSNTHNLSTADTRRAVEVNGPVNSSGNPDEIIKQLFGTQLAYKLNSREWGGEMSLVFVGAEPPILVVVPEPTTLAIWGLCAVGAVIAGRRRLSRSAE
jgi:hypothetical protein